MGAGRQARVAPRGSERDPLEVVLVLGGIAAIALLLWLGWRQAHSWVCGSYNSISNDVCDEWNIVTPPDDELPVPRGWEVGWERLDCGSAGCGTRMYVVLPPGSGEGGVDTYLTEVEALGWTIDGTHARRDDLIASVRPASDRLVRRSIPDGVAQPSAVYVGLSLCGEGATCPP